MDIVFKNTNIRNQIKLSHSFELTFINGPRAGESLDISESKIVVGRGARRDLFVNDANMSRKHFRLVKNKESVKIIDCNSRNGTLVNGVKITNKLLDDGDSILAGSTKFRFSIYQQLESSVTSPVKNKNNTLNGGLTNSDTGLNLFIINEEQNTGIENTDNKKVYKSPIRSPKTATVTPKMNRNAEMTSSLHVNSSIQTAKLDKSMCFDDNDQHSHSTVAINENCKMNNEESIRISQTITTLKISEVLMGASTLTEAGRRMLQLVHDSFESTAVCSYVFVYSSLVDQNNGISDSITGLSCIGSIGVDFVSSELSVDDRRLSIPIPADETPLLRQMDSIDEIDYQDFESENEEFHNLHSLYRYLPKEFISHSLDSQQLMLLVPNRSIPINSKDLYDSLESLDETKKKLSDSTERKRHDFQTIELESSFKNFKELENLELEDEMEISIDENFEQILLDSSKVSSDDFTRFDPSQTMNNETLTFQQFGSDPSLLGLGLGKNPSDSFLVIDSSDELEETDHVYSLRNHFDNENNNIDLPCAIFRYNGSKPFVLLPIKGYRPGNYDVNSDNEIFGIIVVQTSCDVFSPMLIAHLQQISTLGSVVMKSLLLASQVASDRLLKASLANYLPRPLLRRLRNEDMKNLSANAGTPTTSNGKNNEFSETNGIKKGTSVASALRGYEADASVFFVDLCGFTRISENLSSSNHIVDLVNTFFSTVVPSVYQYGGCVDKFLGDGVMGFYLYDNDANILSPDKAAQYAVLSCMSMLTAMCKLRYDLPQWMIEEEPMINMFCSIGVCSGKIVTGSVGSVLHNRLDFTLLGDTVNTASRIEGITPKNSLCISYKTFDLIYEERLRNIFAFKNKGIILKNKREPHVIYTVIAIRDEGVDEWLLNLGIYWEYQGKRIDATLVRRFVQNECYENDDEAEYIIHENQIKNASSFHRLARKEEKVRTQIQYLMLLPNDFINSQNLRDDLAISDVFANIPSLKQDIHLGRMEINQFYDSKNVSKFSKINVEFEIDPLYSIFADGTIRDAEVDPITIGRS
eukprot:TRINITY_DN13701_c0_g1_i1.p1 TRINITY_DN13701_c0_g1~~TRINITY_DN13701_c0_g1_i1.p1  ORF type:complete len:1060 (-),score=263.60 TRINITY_DN13701_c0_g1_i1:142-3252(-)